VGIWTEKMGVLKILEIWVAFWGGYGRKLAILGKIQAHLPTLCPLLEMCKMGTDGFEE